MARIGTAAVDAVVIGASAGGVEALGKLLPHLPADYPLPILVTVHLAPHLPSLLPSLFAAKCTVVVREAEDKEPIRSGFVYFAPPDYHLLVERGCSVALSVDEPVHYSRPSIDALFESAREAYGARLLGILLTGGSQDGAAGLGTIGEAGGLTVVQDPAEALIPDMPRAAVKRRVPSHVLRLEAIAQLLLSASAEPGPGFGRSPRHE